MKMRLMDWVYLTPCDSLWQQAQPSEAERQRRQELEGAVLRALACLPATERAVVEQRYLEGCSFAEIAAREGRTVSVITGRHRRALRRLRTLLAGFVQSRFGIRPERPDCVICKSVYRDAIDRLIAARRPEEPYSVLIRRIKASCGLTIKSPQTIIGHWKYH